MLQYLGTAPLYQYRDHDYQADTSAKYKIVVHDICGTKCNNNCFILVTAPNVILSLSRCFYIYLILVTSPNAFTGCLFIHPFCAHVELERFTDREG